MGGFKKAFSKKHLQKSIFKKAFSKKYFQKIFGNNIYE